MLAGVLAGLVGAGSAPAAAGDAAAKFTETTSSARFEVKGTVYGEPEAVAFSGLIQVRAKTVTDPDFGQPSNIELSVDLSALSGLGLSSGSKYVSQSPASITRPFLRADEWVEIDFPFHVSGPRDFSTYRAGLASLDLVFQVPSGKLVAARGRIETPAP